MNLKEAFRFQNKLTRLMEEVDAFFQNQSNVVKVQTTYLRKKVMPDAEDETILQETHSEFAGRANEMMAFYLYLLEQKEALAAAIHAAKAALPLDMDSQVSLNACRQNMARVFRDLTQIRSGETLIPGGGTGYRFNAEGNQVTYRCDVRHVTTIDFDRNAAKKYLAALDRKADQVSVELDKALINSQVDYEAPFDVNATTADVFEAFLENS